ncbi:MAG: sulfotransferase family 2 domain-containing protein [Deltaproteobacteria bacterium]|nr:sulfotransferase family 2 domain-containing protein [Deltaproteobacteria bacterium]MBW2421294.1 sulfotransferase family 2 domain-containing protein [Deltaproteobacteria bacterium]
MPYFENGGRLIYFAHVPKAAGTSVERYLEARFGPLALRDGGWAEAWSRGGAPGASLRNSPQHVTADDASRLMPRAPDWCFAVVRDPVARVVSEFRMHRRSRRRRSGLTRAGFSPWLSLVLAAARRDPTVFDNHMRPQTDLVPAEAEVFRLEDGLAPLIDRIDAVTGTTAPGLEIGHHLAARDDPQPEPCKGDLRRIAAAFAQDYERFGYPEPAPGEGNTCALATLAASAAPALAPSVVRRYRQGLL